MVATRGTDQIIAFVTGKENIDASQIPAEAWVQILRTAVEELPMNYIRGLKSIEQVLPWGLYRVFAKVEGQLPRLQKDDGREIRPNEVFLYCGRHSSPKDYIDSWSDAPRDRTGKLLCVESCGYLLSRKKKFYCLTSSWNPKEGWDEWHKADQMPSHFWYQLDKDSLKINELDDQKLTERLKSQNKVGLAERMLGYLCSALEETTKDMRGQLEQIVKKRLVIGEYLQRVGSPR